MKKFLSLVLALIMTMSLVTVAGAEDFTDDASIAYEEAVDVVSAVGIVGGYEDGSFNPKGTLTRGAAAKIICNMILGPTTAAALAADAAPYSDVPANHTFAGYIAYCAKEGIVSGYADGTFRPAGTLTGYAFMKMLLGALGYDAEVEGYVGSNWSISVAKRALQLGLDDGLEGKFVGTKALTREEACLYAFNTLNAEKVTYPGKSTIIVDKVTVTTSSEASRDQAANGGYLFRDWYFDDLTDAPAHDAAGRPATTWYTSEKKTKASKVGTYADTADYVLTLEKTYTITDDDDIKKVFRDLADNDDLFNNTKTELYVNGEPRATSDTEVSDANAAGTVIELFCEDDTDGNLITNVTVLDYEIDYIDKLDTKLTKAQKEDGATVEVELKGGIDMLDVDFAGYDADTYVKDAYVLYVYNPVDKVIIASEIAEYVEGEVVQYKKSSAEVSIDGVWYDNVTGSAIKHGTEGKFYLNKADQVAAIDAVEEKSDNYAYIYELVEDKTGTNADGYTTETVTAYFVKADGTKGSAQVDADYSGGKFYYADTNIEVKEDVVIAYTMDDEYLCWATPVDGISQAGSTNLIDKENVKLGSKYVTVDTEFIFLNEDVAKGTMKVTTTTGYKSVSSDTSAKKLFVYDTDTAAVLYCFVDKKNANVDTDLYAVLLSDTPTYDVDDDDVKVYYYDVAIDGEETTLTVKFADDKIQKASVAAGQVFTYEVTEGYVSSVTPLVKTDVVAVYDDYLVLDTSGATPYYYDEETVWTITMEYTDDTHAELDSVVVDEEGSYDKDLDVYFAAGSDKKLDQVWVIEVID